MRHVGTGDAEIKAMNAVAPLLWRIRRDTGEAGTPSGDRIDFATCPVCGHRECFRYYPATNSWACFGQSNASGYDGGSYLEYLLARGDARDYKEAVRTLRREVGNPRIHGGGELVLGQLIRDGADDSDAEADEGAARLLLPRWEAVRAIDPPRRAPELVGGLLRAGHTGLLVAKAKSNKSWAAIALCVAVATGGEWMGHGCRRGRALFIDPELDPKSLANRFAKVCEATGADPKAVQDGVCCWPLRGVLTGSGQAATVRDVAHDLGELARAGELGPDQFSLIVLDSCSALLSGDENASADVRAFHGWLLRIARLTGAAVMCVHHEGKAKSGDLDGISRGRGSSAWGDCFDLVLSLVETFPPSGEVADYLGDGERAFLLEVAAVREFPPTPPQRLVYSYPAFRADNGTTDGWKPRSGAGDGGKQTAALNRAKAEARGERCVSVVLAHMLAESTGPGGLSVKDAADAASDAMGEAVKPARLKAYVEASDLLDLWKKSERRVYVVPRHPPRADGEAAPTLDGMGEVPPPTTNGA